MKRSLLVVVSTTLLPFTLCSSEPSAFGAGDLSNPQPYGLTSNEEVLLETKKDLHKIAVKSNNQANRVESLRERIDGLQSVVESLSRKSHETRVDINKLVEKNTQELQTRDEYEKRLSEITQQNSELSQANAASIEKIKLIITEMSSVVDNINATYVTKDEYNALVKDVNDFKDLVAKELKKLASTGSASAANKSFKNMPLGDIATKAKRYYDKKLYTKAIEYYSYLIEKKYKPARAHYMIGEMNYYRKNYADAIAYFKKSASLYSKASYMPVLMLHTARAMQKTGDKVNAQAFYKGILAKYPDTKYAKEAQKYLDLMNK